MSEDAHYSGPDPSYPPPQSPKKIWPQPKHPLKSNEALALLIFNSGEISWEPIPAPISTTLSLGGRRLVFERYLHADLARPVFLETPNPPHPAQPAPRPRRTRVISADSNFGERHVHECPRCGQRTMAQGLACRCTSMIFRPSQPDQPVEVAGLWCTCAGP